MADKKKDEERSDEDWAQLVADKVAEHPAFTGALDQMKPDAKSVDVKAGQPSIEFVDKGDGKGAQPTNPDGSEDKKYAKMMLDMTREPPDWRPDAQTDKSYSSDSARAGAQALRGSAQGARPPTREGVVFLANTDKNGKKQKGQMIARKMFATDEDFDKFTNDAKSKGNLWEGAADAPSEDGGKGTLAGRLNGALGKLFGNALPEGTEGGPGKSVTVPRSASDQAAESKAAMSSGSSRPAGSDKGALETPGEQAQPLMQHISNLNDQITPGVQKVVDMVGLSPDTRSPEQVAADEAHNNEGMFGRNQDGTNKSILERIGESMGPMQAQPGLAQVPTGPNAPPVLPGGGSVSAQFRGGAPEKQIAPPAAQPDYSGEMRAQADLQKQALGHAAEISAARDSAVSKVQEDTANQQALDSAYAQRKQEFIQQGQNEMMKNISDAQAVLNNPAKTPDPERYWKNHSKVMFAIGVGLLAQAGKDINGVLANANQAIDRDVEEQKQAYEAPRNAARGKQAAAQTMYSMFRDMGHDAFEAQKMAAAVLKDRAQTEIAKIAATSDSQTVKDNAAVAAAQFQMTALKDAQDASNHRMTNDTAMYGHQVTQANDTAKNSNDAAELRFKVSEAGQAKNALSDADSKKLADSVTGLQELTDAGKIFGSGLGSAVYNAFTQLDPTGTTDASAFNNNRQMYTRILSSLLSPAERQNETMMENVGEMVPTAGAANAYQKWQSVLKFIKARVGGEADALRSKGRGDKVDQIMGGAAPKTQTQGILPNGQKVVITD